MKISNYLFWFILALIAVFYITIGNDMNKEKHSIYKAKVEVNLNKDDTK